MPTLNENGFESPTTTCCLCEFESVSANDLENHIDTKHGEIFNVDILNNLNTRGRKRTSVRSNELPFAKKSKAQQLFNCQYCAIDFISKQRLKTHKKKAHDVIN